MCGIFGYIGTNKQAGEIILDGLRSLEYRGYDSWGVALKHTNNTITVEKHTGKIGQATLPHSEATIGIGHTRWATHGGVTEQNAHPHTSSNNDVIVVHNGIVENFSPIKADLEKKGYTFISETDSEVIAHLIAEHKKTNTDNKQIILDVFKKLEGMNAIIAFFPETEEFYAIKNGSPVVFGEGNNEYFIASDASALIIHTKQVHFMEDDEMLHITRSGYTFYDIHGKEKKASFIELQYDKEDTQLGAFPHYMIKEIHEQPKVLMNIVNTQAETIAKSAEIIKKAYGTYLIGCGTASYACLTGTYLFSKIANRHVNFSIGSEFTYLLDFLKDTSLVVALSQSGETIDIISSIQKAKKKNAKIMSITNVLGSSLYRASDYTMLLNAGPEKAVCSTKAYLAKIAVLYLLAHELAGTTKTGVQDITKAIAEIKRILEEEERIQELAVQLKDKNHMFVLGRGVSYPTALESSLKIKEVSYVHAEGFAAGELKHGVIALIEKGTPIIIYNPEDETYDDTLSAAYEVKARGAHVIGISSKENPVYDTFIRVENCNDATIMPNVVIAQLLGYYLAVTKGYDPDKPRNLAKSVTVK